MYKVCYLLMMQGKQEGQKAVIESKLRWPSIMNRWMTLLFLRCQTVWVTVMWFWLLTTTTTTQNHCFWRFGATTIDFIFLQKQLDTLVNQRSLWTVRVKSFQYGVGVRNSSSSLPTTPCSTSFFPFFSQRKQQKKKLKLHSRVTSQSQRSRWQAGN